MSLFYGAARLARRALNPWAEALRLQAFILASRMCGGAVSLAEGNRLQVPLRGGSGALRIGAGNNFGYHEAPKLGAGGILLQARGMDAVIEIGDRNQFNNNITVIACERITIGSDCQIGEMVAVYDCDFHEIDPAIRLRSRGQTRPVTIGNNVWLGSRVMVLKGVTIGDNSVVGAMSLVTKSLPANCVAAGNPAKIIRSLG